MDMLNINKWITFMLQNQFFGIMEDVKTNNESGKSIGSTPQGQVPKPKTTPAPNPSTTGVAASKVAAEKPTETIPPAPEIAPVATAPLAEKKSMKLAKVSKKLTIQKKEIILLEKKRDRLMKDLISAIENKKKSKKIRSLARDFNRIENSAKKRNASYLQAKKKLAKKMK
jgi:hypothetical protein